MAKQTINVGTTANDRRGDSLRAAFQKVNANFTELYTALGLAIDANLNLGAFEFNGSVMTTTDSTPVTIDQQVNITSDLVMSGAVVPATTDVYDLGSPTQQWRSLYLTGSTVYFNGVPLSVTDDGTIIINGEVAATPGGSATWDSVTSKPTFATVATSGSYRDLTNKPTFGASDGLTATTDVNGNVNIGFSGILYVGSQTQYGFEEIVDEGGPSPVYSSRLSLPLITEFLGGDISLTAWGPGVNITVRNTDTLNEYSWKFGNDGKLTLPGGTDTITSNVNGLDLSVLGLDEETVLTVNLSRSGALNVPQAVNFNFLGTYTGLINAQPDELVIAGVPNTSIRIAPNDGANGTFLFGTDGSITYPGDVKQSYQDNTQCLPNVDTVVYTATSTDQNAVKLFVMAEGLTDGGGLSWDTQACDVIAVKGFNNNIVHVTTYGVTYSGASAIAEFDGQWNALTNKIEITCRPTSVTNNVRVSVHAIEMTTND